MRSTAARPRLLFMEQYYFPEGWGGAELPRDITMDLAQSGFDVEVICGSDQYAPIHSSSIVDPASVGVVVRRVPRLIPGPARSLKIVRQLWYYLCLAVMLLIVRRPSLLITQTNPPLGVCLAAAVARLRNLPLLVVAQDLYPEVLVAHGALGEFGIVAKLLRRVFGWAYRSADRIVALGPVMVERIVAKGVARSRITSISNWATGPQEVVRGAGNQLSSEWGLADRFVVLYSGNLGIGHEFDTLLAAFQRSCAQHADLRLVFVGQGSRLHEVQHRVAELGIGARVVFKPLVPSDRLAESLGLADVAVVTLRPGFEGLIVPSKLLGYMARGIPTLYIGPRSDVSELLEMCDGGVVCANDDVAGVEAALRLALSEREQWRARGTQAYEYYREHLTRENSLAQYRELVATMTNQLDRP